MQRFWTLTFWLGWCFIATAQTPAYLHYNVSDGLPGNQVYCGLQDRRGVLWFGTDKGLACFDGIRFYTYGMADGLPDPEVLNMKEDGKGRLWLFCFRKKPCYMLDGRIITDKQDTLLAKIEINTGTYNISEDADGGIWHIEMSEKTYYLKGNRITPVKFPYPIVTIEKIGDDYLALGQNGIMRITPEKNIEVVRSEAFGTSIPNISLSGNHILYSSANVTKLLAWSEGKISKITENTEFKGQTFADHFGRFWVCSPSTGAICFDNDRRDLTNPLTFLPGKKINAMFEDSQGTLWFATKDEGVFALPHNAPLNYRHETFPSANIRSLARAPDGQLLIGDDDGNVHIMSNGRISTIAFGSVDGYNEIRQIIPTGQGHFWAASDEGLHYYSATGGVYKKIQNISLKSITRTPGDTIWFAASALLGYYTFNNPDKKMVIETRFTAVETDTENNVWAGGIEGLYSQKDHFKTNFGDRFHELKSRITAIQRAGENKLWVVTPESGLLSATIRRGGISRVETVNTRLAKPIHNIKSLFTEPDGRVWLATNRGVYSLDGTGQVLHFDTHDGLSDDDVNTVLVHEDTLWAGTASGLTRILLHPSGESGNFASYISGIHYQLDNRTVSWHLLDSTSVNHVLQLPTTATNLTLELAGLDFRSRGNMRFIVEEQNLLPPVKWWTFNNLLDWVSSRFTGTKTVIYPDAADYGLGAYLPPGKYQWKVTAVKSSGERSLRPDTWTIVKPSRWFETLWFYLLIWGAVLYGIWHIYRARMTSRELRAAASGLQLQALQAQMNPHFIGNAINAIQQFIHPPDPLKISEYISLFMRLLRRTMLFSEKTFIDFSEELAYEKEYLLLTKLRFEERFRYEINGAESIPAHTPVPSMLLQPVLENATIHGLAPDGLSVLRIDFSYENGQFQCAIEDNGIGIKETQRLKLLSGIERESKGIGMLRKKIITLNRLYDLDIRMEIKDLSESNPLRTGTRVFFTYSPANLWKVIKKHPANSAPISNRSVL